MASLYLRKGRLFLKIQNEWIDAPSVVTIANITAKEPGKGAFTTLIEYLKVHHPEKGIFVENILINKRFEAKLQRMNFVKTDEIFACYYWKGSK